MKETSWLGIKTLNAAGALRKKQDGVRTEAKRRDKEKVANERFTHLKSMATSAVSLLRRLVRRDGEAEQSLREDDMQNKGPQVSIHDRRAAIR